MHRAGDPDRARVRPQVREGTQLCRHGLGFKSRRGPRAAAAATELHPCKPPRCPEPAARGTLAVTITAPPNTLSHTSSLLEHSWYSTQSSYVIIVIIIHPPNECIPRILA